MNGGDFEVLEGRIVQVSMERSRIRGYKTGVIARFDRKATISKF